MYSRAGAITALRSAAGQRGADTYVYRYDWFFKSNKKCTAVANYHEPELGSMHQDEVRVPTKGPRGAPQETVPEGVHAWARVRFTAGRTAEHCRRVGPLSPRPQVSFVFGQPIKMNLGFTNCSDPGWAGYDKSCEHCVFDEVEERFSYRIGAFWANVAAHGNPNGERGLAAAADEWPRFNDGRKNIILRASTSDSPMDTESSIGREAACAFWLAQSRS